MPYNTQSEQIAFFNGNTPILRCLPLGGHPQREMLGNSAEIYEGKQVEREGLIRLMKEWGEKLSKTPKCVWESDQQHETIKEIKRFRRNPEVAVPELKKSYHGCLFLINQWDHLKRIVNAESFCGEFRTSDETLILGLCEVPFWNRNQSFDFMPSAEMTPEEAYDHISSFIQQKIDSLQELSLARRAEAERERELAIAAPEFFPDKQLRAWARDLHKLERELIGIFTYVQSLLNPDTKPTEAPSGEPAQLDNHDENRAKHSHQIEAKVHQEAAECRPVVNMEPQVAKMEHPKTPLPSRATPAQSKTVDRRNKRRSRKERSREVAKHESRRILADIMDKKFEQSNILGITVGKRLF